MSLLFYSRNRITKEIEGASGVKAIYINDDAYIKYFQELVNLGDPTTPGKPDNKIDNIANIAWNMFQDACNDQNLSSLKEEMHHFQIIRASNMGKLLYLWNPLLRVAYSSTMNGIVDWYNLKTHSVIIEVIRYFRANTLYHLIASPILEYSYSIESNDKTPIDNLYLADLEKGLNFLNDEIKYSDIDSIIFSKQYLADVIDDAVWQLHCDNNLNEHRINYQKNPKNISLFKLALLYKTYSTVLSSPKAWPVFFKSIIASWRPITKHYVKILITKKTPKSEKIHDRETPDTVTFPGLWCPKGTIDPAGFISGTNSLGSHEKPFANNESKAYSDLLWYILARSSEIPEFKRAGWSKIRIKQNFRLEWGFLLKGTQYILENQLFITKIDNILVDGFWKSRIHDSNDNIYTVAEKAIDLFQQVITLIHEDNDADLNKLAISFNRQYIQI